MGKIKTCTFKTLKKNLTYGNPIYVANDVSTIYILICK